MIKAAALNSFWFPSFAKTKKTAIKSANLQSQTRYYFAVGLIAINAIMLMSYVYGVNKYASIGYEIKSVQKSLTVLNEDNRKINLKISEANSMVSIQSDFLSSNFVVSGTPKFLQATQFTLK